MLRFPITVSLLVVHRPTKVKRPFNLRTRPKCELPNSVLLFFPRTVTLPADLAWFIDNAEDISEGKTLMDRVQQLSKSLKPSLMQVKSLR